jgi:hypothetical protein
MVIIETPKYIESIELDIEEVLSYISVEFQKKGIDEFIRDKTFTVVWSEGDADEETGKIKFRKKIYKTKQGFYLYLLLNGDGISMVVYYKQHQINELTIFISQLLKQFNNDKTINK